MNRMRGAIVFTLILGLTAGGAMAQQNSQIRNLLQRYKNWRYGMVSVYKVNEMDNSVVNLNAVLGPREPELPDEAKSCKYKDDIESYVLTGGEGMDEKEIEKTLRSPGCKAYERFYTLRMAWERAQFKKAYVITTRRYPGQPFQVIGLLVQKTTESYYGIKEDLDPPSDIFLQADLSKDLDQPVMVSGVVKKAKDVLETSAGTLLEYFENQVIQGNYENVTPEVQGIGEEGVRFSRKSFGNGELITEDDPQAYIRITEGLPMNLFKENELTVSAVDGVSFRHYERPIDPSGSGEVDSTKPLNDNLPKYGVELRYGLEDINYPSLWSERMSLNALWGASRLGVVLPTNGWSSLAADMGNTRTMTHAGFGLNGSFDFPIRVISQSGVFNISTSYVFDDANKSNHMVFDDVSNRYEDYLVRYHASLQYSFAIKIDKDFMFRMRLGGTIYAMETWGDRQVVRPDTAFTEYAKLENETVGSVSGRIDFMTTGWSTPVGFSLSYFDESMLTTAWLQVPIMSDFAMRFDARIFTPVFRSARVWESSAVVIPSLRFVYNF